jgi:hypothetical protein
MADGTTAWDVTKAALDGASSLAAVAAVFISVVTLRRQQDDARRKQASRVVASYQMEFLTDRPEGGTHLNLVHWRVDNFSDLPIYKVEFLSSAPVHLPAGESNIPYFTQLRVKASATCTYKYRSLDDLRVVVVFVDTVGRRWRRTSDGELKFLGKDKEQGYDYDYARKQ